LIGIAPDPVEEGITGFHIQLHGCNTCTILAAVVLLLYRIVAYNKRMACVSV
jgi:hypothetical protein